MAFRNLSCVCVPRGWCYSNNLSPKHVHCIDERYQWHSQTRGCKLDKGENTKMRERESIICHRQIKWPACTHTHRDIPRHTTSSLRTQYVLTHLVLRIYFFKCKDSDVEIHGEITRVLFVGDVSNPDVILSDLSDFRPHSWSCGGGGWKKGAAVPVSLTLNATLSCTTTSNPPSTSRHWGIVWPGHWGD